MRMARPRTARSRAKRRGAVLVEALMVASMLALFLTGAIFFHAVYSAKLSTLREARAEAWRKALEGCGGGLATLLLNNMGAITALTEAEDIGVLDAPDWLTNVGRGVGDPAPVTVTPGPWLNGQSIALKTRRSVACNEYGDQKAGDSNLGAIFQAVKDMFISH